PETCSGLYLSVRGRYISKKALKLASLFGWLPLEPRKLREHKWPRSSPSTFDNCPASGESQQPAHDARRTAACVHQHRSPSEQTPGVPRHARISGSLRGRGRGPSPSPSPSPLTV